MNEWIKPAIFFGIIAILIGALVGILAEEFEKTDDHMSTSTVSTTSTTSTTNTEQVVVYYRDVVNGCAYIHFRASDGHEYIGYNHGLVHATGCRARH